MARHLELGKEGSPRMRIGRFASGVAVVAMMLAPSSAAGQDVTRLADCIGLTCVEPASPDQVPEAHGSVPSVSGPEQLARQQNAGFYEFGSGTSLRRRAVAYVVPYGQHGRMPASVRDLPVVRAIETGSDGRSDFQSGTVVIFEPYASLFVGTTATTARQPRVRARASAEDAWRCQDNYFCLYDSTDWEPTISRVQFGSGFTGAGWFNLSDFGYGDIAESMRNRRDRDSLLARDFPPGGSTRYCADSHSSDKTFSNNPIGNNHASSFANVPDDIHC
jgi:hypothetical protein